MPESCQLGKKTGGGPVADLFREVICDATDGHIPGKGTGGLAILGTKTIEGDLRLLAIFRRYARLLLDAPTIELSRAATSGPRLGDLVRIRTDQRVFLRRSRRVKVGTAVAICLDVSGSMNSRLKTAASAAGAMAKALSDAGGNVACWHFGSVSRRVPLRRISRAVTFGSTRTDLAIADARNWLLAQPQEKKVVAVFTDGQPDLPDLCVAQVQACNRTSIALLVGSFEGVTHEMIHKSMPGAELFSLGGNFQAGFHYAIRRIARMK
jgi:hypothetical protein